jgi:acyl-coenzyme A synthetase/AMP-(fatty) acid ligase
MQNPIHYLSFQAKTAPNNSCLITHSQILNYKDIFNIIQRVSSEFKIMGLKKGDLIATSFKDPALDFIVTLASFQLGLTTCALHAGFSVPSNIHPKLILTDSNTKNALHRSEIFQIDKSWFQKIQSNTINNLIENYESDDLIRLILSSGTTGNSKVIALDFQKFSKRLLNGLSYWITSSSEINLQALSTVGGIFTVMERLYLGLPIFLSPQPTKLISEHEIFSLTGSPTQISDFIDKVKNLNIRRLDQVTISGGMISENLHQRIIESLTDFTRNVYGSTEIGGISLLRIDKHKPTYGCGQLLPEIEIDILSDDSSQNDGLIRLKSPNMVTKYFNDEESTKKYFRDGWFYPGDRGYVTNDGLLSLSGRNDELINAGGVKVNPSLIDGDILGYPGILDGACFGIEDRNGITQVACAVVSAEDVDLKNLYQHLLKKHGIAKTPRTFFKVTKIPRNTMGKPLRLNMTQQFTEHLKKNS